MERTPRLIATRVPRAASAAVLVLHGGASRPNGATVSPAQLSVVRMVPIAAHLARVGAGRLAVFRLLNSYRGWDARRTPVQDATWALREIRSQLGELDVCLVGHSLGGRAALLTAAQPGVVSVVALAPWFYADDRPDVTGRRVLMVHGSNDSVADPAKSAAVARAMGSSGVGYVLVAGGKHAMLRHHRRFTELTSAFVLATLLGVPATGPVAEILDGERWLTI